MMLTKIQLRPASVMAHLTENEAILFNTARPYDFAPPREVQAQSESISPLKSARPAVPAITAIPPMTPTQTFNFPTKSHAARHTTSPFVANASTTPSSLKERPIMASTSPQETVRLSHTPVRNKRQLRREKSTQQSYHLSQTCMSSMQFPDPLDMQQHSHRSPRSVSGVASASDGDMCGDRRTNYGIVTTANVSDSESECGADRISVAASSAVSGSRVSSGILVSSDVPSSIASYATSADASLSPADWVALRGILQVNGITFETFTNIACQRFGLTWRDAGLLYLTKNDVE